MTEGRIEGGTYKKTGKIVVTESVTYKRTGKVVMLYRQDARKDREDSCDERWD